MGHRDTKNLQPKTLEKLEKIKQILKSGTKTLRRVFYILASGSYDSLGKLMVWARLNNEIGWGKIREEGRYLEGSIDYNSLKEFFENVAELYVKNKEGSFKNYFEVWLEKATLKEVFLSVTDKYGVGLLVTRGQNSWTALHKASKRLNSNSMVLYFGDNDSYGNRMFKQSKEFLNKLGCKPKFIKLALTTGQEKKFKFPIGEHHLDGMPEDELVKLLEASIIKQIDLDKFNSLVKKEAQEREQIRRMIK